MTPARRHPKTSVVFLIDVDNTLLNDDRVLSDLRRHMKQEIGRHGEQRYKRILERLHHTLGYADYLGASNGIANNIRTTRFRRS